MPAGATETQDALSKVEYERIRKQLSFRPDPWMAALTLAVNAAFVAGIALLLASGGTAAYWTAQFLIPMAMFQAFSVLHDCGHSSFSANRRVNTLVGHYASLLCCMPYFPWKYIHAEHHVWAGNPDRDPGLAIVRRAREGKVPWILSAAWRSWFPLAGVAQHVVFWMYPVVQARRGGLSRGKLLRCAASVAWLASAYVALHVLFPSVVSWRALLPGLALYVMLVELVNVPHHTGLTAFDGRLPLWRQSLPSRSCNYPPVISELLVLNFNFHIEHHLFPHLPWYRLRAARRLIKPALGYRYREAHGLNWAIGARKQNLKDVLALVASDFVTVPPVSVDAELPSDRAREAPADQGRELPT